jgi:hypothetical protein
MTNKQQSESPTQDLLMCEGSMVFGYVVALLFICLVACVKKTGDAVVIGKDYVAAVKQGEEIKDQRSTNHDQWIVKARMRDNGRTIEVRADRAQWEKLRENDQIKVTYRTGNYTGTVWDSEIG